MSTQGKFENKAMRSIWLEGTIVQPAVAGTTAKIRVYFYDENHDIMQASGTDVPADTTNGYAKGCFFIDKDVAAGTTGVYVNLGDSDACNFDVVPAT